MDFGNGFSIFENGFSIFRNGFPRILQIDFQFLEIQNTVNSLSKTPGIL